MHPSRIDCRLYRRNLPWGQPLKLPWTLHRGGVLNAAKTASSENTSVEVQSKHSLEENNCMTSSMNNRVSIPPKRFRFGLSDVRECHSYLQGQTQVLSTIGFLFLSKGLEFRLSGDGSGFISRIQGTLFSVIWLTVIEWLGIDLTDSVNAPFVLSHLPTSRNLHILGFTTSTECGQ